MSLSRFVSLSRFAVAACAIGSLVVGISNGTAVAAKKPKTTGKQISATHTCAAPNTLNVVVRLKHVKPHHAYYMHVHDTNTASGVSYADQKFKTKAGTTYTAHLVFTMQQATLSVNKTRLQYELTRLTAPHQGVVVFSNVYGKLPACTS